jgi:hypothetical protein
LALKPNDGETFLKEVDDELRREQLTTFFTRYGWWIIGGVVLILGAVGGYLWWSGRQVAARESAGENLVAAVDQLEAGNQGFTAAQPQIDALAANGIEGYRAAALFARATGQAQSGNAQAAITTLRQIGDDQSLDQVYRDAALIRRTQLEFDRLQPQEVIRRLTPLATGNGAWAGSAGELVGVAHLKMNRPDLAGPVFVRVARDENAPTTLRERASLMAGSLGFDPDPNTSRSTAPTRPPAPAPAPAATAPAPAATAPAPATREKAR